MKASQYLYTSYKNSPNGGYAIYSMSPDISQEDAKVIFLLMQYPAVPMLSDTRRSQRRILTISSQMSPQRQVKGFLR